MGNNASNSKRGWGDKEHLRTDAGHVNFLVNKQKWDELVNLVSANPEGVRMPDKLNQGMLPIHRAILKGASCALIEKLVEVYPDGLMVSDENGMLPLHYCAIYNFCIEKNYMKLHNPMIADSWGHVLKLLIKTRPLAAKEIDQEGRTPLHVAAASKACAKAIEDLLSVHHDAAARRTKLGKLPIHYALDNRAPTDSVKVILAAYPNAVGESSQRRNPLHCAVENYAAAETVMHLIEAYPEGVSEKSIESMLPLHLACAHKQPLCVIEKLISLHPDSVYDRDRHARLPLHHAIENNAPDEVVLYLLDQAPDSAKLSGYFPHLPLHIAVEKLVSLPVLEALLRCHPGSCAERDMFGVLPLRRIIKSKGSEETVLAVLADAPEASGDLDEYERLALHYACARKMSTHVISKLIDACPPSISVPDKNGQLPLHLAVMRFCDEETLNLLIQKFPDAVMIADNYNYLPLHHCIELDAPAYVYEVLIRSNQGCAAIRLEGKPPLHFAIEMRRAHSTLEMMIEAYPDVASEKETERGRLPLCWAMERELPLETLLLIEKYYPVEKAAFETDDSGRFPMHYCVEYDAPAEMARMLLRANPLVATTKEVPFYYYVQPEFMDENTISYVAHGKSVAAMEEEARAAQAKEEARVEAEKLQKQREARAARHAALKNHNESVRLSNNPQGKLEVAEVPSDVGPRPDDTPIQDPYKNNPPVVPVTAGPVSMRKKRDNHGDVSDVVIKKKDSLSVGWDEQFQRSRPLVRRPGKMLIHYATEDMHCNAKTVAEILMLCMPITADTGAVNTYHGYGWTYLLSDTQDKYVDTVNIILDRYSTDMKFIQLLCDTPNETGLTAGEVATPKCLQAIMARLHYFSRYQLAPGDVAHESTNSVVRLAIDHSHLFGGPVKEKVCEEKKVVRVAVKFMKYREQYDREVQMRSSVALDEKFVVPLLTSHDGDADPAYKKETIKKGMGDYPYLITMVAAERDLLSAIQHEHFAGRDFVRVKRYAQQILQALEHIHGEGILHGDIKPLNVVRASSRFKLIDLGAAVRFGDFAGTGKVSTAYLPPEMVFKQVAAFGSKEEVAPNDKKVDYFSLEERTDYTLSAKTGLAVYPEINNEVKEVTASDYIAPGEKPRKPKSENPSVDPLPAHPSMDMWGFGVMLYLMATGENLFVSDIDDNVDEDTLQKLVEPFPDKFKGERLAKCSDHWTRNLLFQSLSRDPRRRPTASEALAHPYFTGVNDDIKENYRMPGQPSKYDVCICYSTRAHSEYRVKTRHRHFVDERNAAFAEKERVDAEEIAMLQAEHAKSKHSFLQVEFKPSSPPWVEPVEPEYLDCDQEEEAEELEKRLVGRGYKVCRCEGGKGLLNSHCAVIILSRKCVNNDAHPQQNFVNFKSDSDYDPYFFEIRLALEMQAQSYLEGGVISLAVGDKEQGEEKLKRLMAEKATRDRADAIAAERQRARDLALERKQKRNEAAERSRAKKQAAMRGGRKSGKAESPSRSSSSLSPSREGKAQTSPNSTDIKAAMNDESGAPENSEDEGQKAQNKFWADEEAIRNNSLEPSYLPYYASFENEIIGQYGGAHPSGDLCRDPVMAIEKATVTYLCRYFLGKVPVINDADCSPAKLMTRITKAKQVLLMGEEERAWKNSVRDIHNHLRGATPEEVAMDAAASEEAEEDDEAKLQAIAKFLRKQMKLKNDEIEQLEKQQEAAIAQMQDRRDELQALRAKYSIF